MIEPTDEMRKAIVEALPMLRPTAQVRPWVIDGVAAAVLAIVERDYVVRPATHRVNERLRTEAREPDSAATYGPDKPRLPDCPVVGELCPGDDRGVLCLTPCRAAP